MEGIARRAILCDFYGELLTERQRRVYEDVAYRDLSLGEIAENLHISRQAVHDILRRSDQILSEYEEKLCLAERFFNVREKVRHIRELSDQRDRCGSAGEGDIREIYRLAGQILEEL